MNHPQQPREYDAVLGGNSSIPECAAVLGGIEGVKLRLQNPDAKVRIAALEQAVNYGEQGLDLVIAGLKDDSLEVQKQAYILLNDWQEKQQLLLMSQIQKQHKIKSSLMIKMQNLFFNQEKDQKDEEEKILIKQALLEKVNYVLINLIEDVRLRFKNSDSTVRFAAFEQALNYGEQGLDLVIEALKNESWDIQNAAYLILNKRTEPRIKQILQDPRQLGFKLEQIEVVTTNKYGKIIQRQPRVARYFIEDLDNSVKLEMAAIPGGTFMMGSPENEERRRDRESPQHQVTVPSFFMGKYPVTQAQYQAIMGTNPSYFNGSNRPVERVIWNDAIAFCEKLSQRTGKNYRLPSEAEWEYACRAGTTTPFHFGETITTDLANYNGDYTYGGGIKGIYREETTEVGSFGVANNFGLYDMHGNVWEWCEDSWYTSYKGAPTDGSAWLDTEENTNSKLLRGGSWLYNPGNCRSAYRHYYIFDYTYNHIGFRVVCSGAART
ncbi:formylglycine-generating enzyme family protein [Dolichospermum compactum]|uniref:Sulfatase-modifying factor enzyme-like domain-containing protein n=1 Tax=Dolichospermum compactum NIES-806 TaxID=1973481 RepID=A0A1Z4V0Y1_9CYAN|nr:formylglycine-generating enzyme family protein [Dolichospermum compactum]BAZ85094.1 hypothetical protein NIES806_12940 [Dolichospermum compactum NIES-806]